MLTQTDLKKKPQKHVDAFKTQLKNNGFNQDEVDEIGEIWRFTWTTNS